MINLFKLIIKNISFLYVQELTALSDPVSLKKSSILTFTVGKTLFHNYEDITQELSKIYGNYSLDIANQYI